MVSRQRLCGTHICGEMATRVPTSNRPTWSSHPQVAETRCDCKPWITQHLAHAHPMCKWAPGNACRVARTAAGCPIAAYIQGLHTHKANVHTAQSGIPAPSTAGTHEVHIAPLLAQAGARHHGNFGSKYSIFSCLRVHSWRGPAQVLIAVYRMLVL